MNKRGTALALSALALSCGLWSQEASLRKATFAPSDKPETILSLSAAARVSVAAASSSGVPISLHDRMEGLLARAGSRGAADGRIDISLDAGEYKVRLEGQDSAGKAISLAARLFRETNGDNASAWPRLVPGATLGASLKDLESASYWVEQREDGPLEVEALGRDLAAAEVWREGQYLVGSYAPREERSVEAGRPMGWICASLDAKAGLYLVRLFGGPSRAWPKDDAKRPLYVRSGFLRLPSGGRLDVAVSPFGRDFVLASGIGRAVMTRKEKGAALIACAPYSAGGDRLSSSDSASLAKTATFLSCAVEASGDGPVLIRLEAAPGDVLLLDASKLLADAVIPARDLVAGGLLTISSPRSSAPELEATGLVYRRVKSGASEIVSVVEDFCAPLSGGASIRRRCNVGSGGDRSLYVRVEEAGSYRIAEKAGTGQGAAIYRMSMLDSSLRDNGLAKAYPAGKSILELAKGYYRLDISALGLGVLDFMLYKDAFARNVKDDLAKDPPAARSSYSWALAPSAGATDLYVAAGRGPSLEGGLSLKPFPLALEDGLNLELGAGDELALAFASKAPGRFRWTARGGSLLIDGQAAVDGSPLSVGRRNLLLRNSGAGRAALAFAIDADFGGLSAPAPTSFGQGIAALSPSTPTWRDFKRSERAVYAFEVRESAVYVIESQGRLSTSLVLRTASRTRLFQASENGYGRNASLRTWLRRGQYYVEVAASGAARGRAGVRMDRVPLPARVALDAGAVDRRALPADSAVEFGFALQRDASVDVYSVGLSGIYPIRLEDEDGFIAYAGAGRTKLDLAAGRYSLYSLPVSLETNRLTWIEIASNAEAAAPVAGTRGLPLGGVVEAVWKEKAEGDRYSFTSPAELSASFRLPAEFDASLAGPDGTKSLDPKSRSGVALKRGTYVLAVRPREKANQLAYSVGVEVDGLAPGISRRVSVGKAGAVSKVSVPDDGFYEIWSLGRNDVTARLFREGEPAPIAVVDDNGPDWNIDIVQRLKAGRYRLELSSLAGAEDAVELTMVSRNARALDRASSSFEGRIALDQSGIVLPFDTKAEEGLFLVSGQGDAPVSFRLYRGDDLIAAADGRVAIPLRKASSYSLYAWTPFSANSAISVKRLPDQAGSLSRALALKAGGVLRLQNDEGLSARVASGSALVSAGFELPCADPGDSPFSALPEGGWAYAPAEAATLEPLALAGGEGEVLSLAAADQGFAVASAEKAILLSADTRGQFRCGLSGLLATRAGAAPYDWDASAAWSQGSVALLPPGQWKARVWDGQRGPGLIRRIGVGADFFELAAAPALSMGGRDTLSVPAGKAIFMDAPACSLSVLLGEGLVISAWRDGDAVATRAAYDGRVAESLSLPECRIYIANGGQKDASVRLAVLPARAAADEELSAARPFEAIAIPAEGVRLQVKAAPQELLCLAGASVEIELETGDGRYATAARDPADGYFTSLPAASGFIRIRSSGGFARAWLSKPGRELEGLLERDARGPARELKDAALLAGKGEAFRVVLQDSGYIDISCPGPGLLSLAGASQSGASQAPRILVSGSREDMHLFAWLPAGEYSLWRRPARGSSAGGIIRLDRIESREADAASLAQKAFIGAREYQAWSFAVSAAGLVGVGVKADRDGLEGFLYDSRQGLVGRGPLMFAKLDPGRYLLVVKGLDSVPMEYSLVLAGTEGSRLGVPSEVVDSYKADTRKPSSIAVPMRTRKSPGRQAAQADQPDPQAYDDGEDGGGESDVQSSNADGGDGDQGPYDGEE